MTSKFISIVLMTLLTSFIIGCSGNDSHLITTEQEVATMGESMNAYLLKNVTQGMSKKEMCAVTSSAISEGLNSAGSSFTAMNNWIREYKNPSFAFTEQTYTSQVAKVISGIIIESTKCQPSDLTGDAAEFIGYIKENIYDRMETEKRQEKERKAAKIAKLEPELKKIMAEIKVMSDQCRGGIDTNKNFAGHPDADRLIEERIIEYKAKLPSLRKCQEDYLIKEKENTQKAEAAKQKKQNEKKLALAKAKKLSQEARNLFNSLMKVGCAYNYETDANISPIIRLRQYSDRIDGFLRDENGIRYLTGGSARLEYGYDDMIKKAKQKAEHCRKK